MKTYYRWNTKAKAEAALDNINAHAALPQVSFNAETGEPEPGRQVTNKWYDDVIEFTDGKWGFPRIEDSRLDSLNIDISERQAWLDAFAPSIDSDVDHLMPQSETP